MAQSLSVIVSALDGFSEPWHIGFGGHVVFVEWRLSVGSGPGLADAHRLFGHRHGMLCGCDGSFFGLSVMARDEFCRRHLDDIRVGHRVAEAPVVLGPDIALSIPLVVSPPHVAQGEEGEDFFRVGIYGGVVGAVGIVLRAGVIKEQWSVVPEEPQIAVASWLVVAFVELCDDADGVAVVRPEDELRCLVALCAHLFHGPEEHFPLVPVAYAVGDVEHEYVDAGILQH